MMKDFPRCCLILLLFWISCSHLAEADDARQIVRRAVQSELKASAEDHTRWRYRDEEREKGTVSYVVETDAASVKRLVERGGHALSPEEAKTENDRVNEFIHDSSKLQKQRKDGASDDKSAEALLRMLPDAFTWKVLSDNGAMVTLGFEPESTFNAPDMQSRVMGTMRGEMVVDKRQQRIRTIKGTLTQDVNIGFGLLGRLKRGGTFDVERREVKPGLWQITETHVHIDGKALFFKTIGQQQDEVQTEFREVPKGTTLEQAAEISKSR